MRQAAMLAVKGLAGVAPDVNLRNNMQARKRAAASEKSTVALKPMADINRRPKRGVSVPRIRQTLPKFEKKHFLSYVFITSGLLVGAGGAGRRRYKVRCVCSNRCPSKEA